MPVIDFHAHIYPNKIAEKATNATADFYGISPACIGTGDELLKEGKRAGIDEFVLLPVATKPGQVRHVNAFILEEAAAHREFHGSGSTRTISGCLRCSTRFREGFRCWFTAATSGSIFPIPRA